MEHDQLQKVIRLALNNPSSNEAGAAALRALKEIANNDGSLKLPTATISVSTTVQDRDPAELKRKGAALVDAARKLALQEIQQFKVQLRMKYDQELMGLKAGLQQCYGMLEGSQQTVKQREARIAQLQQEIEQYKQTIIALRFPPAQPHTEPIPIPWYRRFLWWTSEGKRT